MKKYCNNFNKDFLKQAINKNALKKALSDPKTSAELQRIFKKVRY